MNGDLETANRIAALIFGYRDDQPEYTQEVLRRQATDRLVASNAWQFATVKNIG